MASTYNAKEKGLASVKGQVDNVDRGNVELVHGKYKNDEEKRAGIIQLR